MAASASSGGEIRDKLRKIPVMRTNAGPLDKEKWTERLKEEYKSIIAFIKSNQESGDDWFSIESSDDGLHWFGTCSHVYQHLTYEFKFEFDIPTSYPVSAPEIAIPELEGKTVKMYRGGKICLTVHFKPLWARNQPRFGIAHALALGLSPWLATEVPHLVDTKMITHPSLKTSSS
ncbi:putative UFC1, UFM1-specific E2 conjugating enzyme [Monocercomonoides exilis]|uniref:putative UFC1, UFM1-specific E2 conjugating enzyme n=1 Tax=Monocercomonoides exilis TaxID=2049356 RepID=UPI003559A721|nr:putative UFC1, UFM1-specific E2 conjugating enzyme [Monocercomonoides exilis]|eukprot:MONOS_13424.1-p1 / transcript=MONOS_13424.1 / gene=MONOS_13424 / organism=Monocercomonoides_exilis_PA203 / gene_product= UFC1, UFM1-specific E2 conjugating enzyme / transcript_product= UFC1, UFM1-specific E2 conjugating enzyme / location=Mono_scaffold00826:25239-25913(+) / protein_length=175 / sequence_SO=supercontig / SO=protein_coding / is_pseudo=false